MSTVVVSVVDEFVGIVTSDPGENVVVTLTSWFAPSTSSRIVQSLPALMLSTRSGVGGLPAGYTAAPLLPSEHSAETETALRCGSPGPLTLLTTSRLPTSYAVAPTLIVVERTPAWARMSFCATCCMGR